MAIEINDLIPDKNTSWENHSGASVEEYIKRTLDEKAGYFYYDANNNRFLVFSDSINKDLYLEDPNTHSSLIIGTFDAPFNYTATISLVDTQMANYIQYGSTGNYIKATFDVLNKAGASVGENVNVTIVFRNGSKTSQIIRSVTYGTQLSLNIDEYLFEGTNTITITAVGQNTLAATSIGLTYYVINLTLSDSFDISQHLSPTGNLNVLFNITGNGIKRLQWFIDGEQVQYDSQDDDITASEASRTKTIPLAQYNLQRGRHNLQYRAYIESTDGSLFYSNTMFRDFIVDDGRLQDYLTVTAFDFPYSEDYGDNGIIDPFTEPIPLYGVVQYISKNIKYAINAPFGEETINITLGQLTTSYTVSNNTEYTYTIHSFVPGQTQLNFDLRNNLLEFNVLSEATSYNDLSEITSGLVFAFDKSDSTNSSNNRDAWSYGEYSASMNGFSWTNRSGWTDEGLLMPNGASFITNFAPLASEPKDTGITLEFEFETLRVLDDSAVICDLRSNGVGLLITASEASFTSRGGVSVSTKYKSGVPLRISFVVNPPTAQRNKNLLFIYIDGILAGAMNYANADSFLSTKFLQFMGSPSVTILLKQIRCYSRALSSNEILNNYILYRSTTQELISTYDRNNILDNNGHPSYERLSAYTPIIIITGDVEKLMNFDRTNKGTYVKMEKIEIINNFDPTKNLTIVDASMRCQGTSSMDYPKKNFRFYTQKDSADSTVNNYTTRVYDYQGNELFGKDRVYAFKDGSQAVSCWCLKADYAESSSTHNTGIARLWNTVMKNAVIDNKIGEIDSRHYVLQAYPNSTTPCRTLAQHAAIANGFDKDVRTTVDGFPIVLFYRRYETDALICLGKYNWNNDKSTESVYGFVDIPGFDDSNMECWEIINGDYPANTFDNVSNWDVSNDPTLGWRNAFESRYPDDSGKTSEATRANGALRTVAEWINSTKGASAVSNENIIVNDSTLMEKFSTEKWQHLDVYKVAAYYIYLMRFGGVDQTVKNAMFTTEDGIHWYFINYDNDTILGVRNDGLLKFGYDIDRQSKDPDNAEAYCYAGHNSVLWNNLEADTEFMNIVKQVDQALFNAGLTYPEVIKMFNNEQSGKWSERLHNYDYTYKYLDVWLDDQNMQLNKLQGPRRTHREWWLSNRFAIYDAKNRTGQYLESNVSIKPSTSGDAAVGDIVKVTPIVNDQVFGWRLGTNGTLYSATAPANSEMGFDLHDAGISYYIGGSLFFFNAVYMKKIDFSAISSHIQELSFEKVNSDVFDSYLEDVVVSNESSITNTAMTKIDNIGSIKYLRSFQMRNCVSPSINNLDFSNNIYLENLDLRGCTSLTNVTFPVAAPLRTIKLPNSIQTLQIEDLTDLTELTLDLNGSDLTEINAYNCLPFTSSIDWIEDWMSGKTDEHLATCSLYADNIEWYDVNVESLLALGKLQSIKLKGVIYLENVSIEQMSQLQEVYGDHCFDSTNELWITVDSIDQQFSGPTEIVEGEYADYIYAITGIPGIVTYSLLGNTRSGVTLNSITGRLETEITNEPTSELTVGATFISSDHTIVYTVSRRVTVHKQTYPSQNDISIDGTVAFYDFEDKTYTATITNFEDFTGYNSLTFHWSVIGDIANYYRVVNEQQTDSIGCVLHCYNTNYDYTTGSIRLELHNSLGTTVAFKEVAISGQSGNIAITMATNPQVMTIFWNCFGANGTKEAGKIANQTYVTKTEAATFLSSDFVTSSGTIFNTSAVKNTITHFEEIKWFTSLTSIPAKLFYECKNLRGDLILPDSVTTIYGNAFTGENDKNLEPRIDRIVGNEVTTWITPGIYEGDLWISYLDLPKCSTFNLTYSTRLKTKATFNLPSWTSGDIRGSGNNLTLITGKLDILSSENAYNIFKNNIDLVITNDAPLYSNLGFNRHVISQDPVTYENSIKSITVEEDNPNYEIINGCLYTKDTHRLLKVPSTVAELILAEDTTSIANYAATGCTALTGNIVVPDTVTSIGSYAFAGSGISQVTFGNGSYTLSNRCFEQCSSLLTVDCNNAVKSLPERCFRRCTALTNISNLNGIVSIGDYCFQRCSSLQSIILPTVGLTGLGTCCFSYCTSLIELNVPGTVVSIPHECVSNCTNLRTLVFNHGTINIGPTNTSTGFTSGCTNLEKIIIPATLTKFNHANYAYFTNPKIKTAGPIGGDYNIEFGWYTSIITNGLTSSSLTEVTIPANIATIQSFSLTGENVSTVYCYRTTAPTVSYTSEDVNGFNRKGVHGSLGINVAANVQKTWHVPQGSTGYSGGAWDYLFNTLGFELVEDL